VDPDVPERALADPRKTPKKKFRRGGRNTLNPGGPSKGCASLNGGQKVQEAHESKLIHSRGLKRSGGERENNPKKKRTAKTWKRSLGPRVEVKDEEWEIADDL